MAAGLATLGELARPGVYDQLAAAAEGVAEGFSERAAAAGVPFSSGSLGGMFGFSFHPGPIRNFDDAQQAHPGRFRRFFDSMLESGIYLAPSAFEAGFVSLAHGSREVRRTLKAAELAFGKAARIR